MTKFLLVKQNAFFVAGKLSGHQTKEHEYYILVWEGRMEHREDSEGPRLLNHITALLGVSLALVGVWIAGFGGFSETLLRVGTYALGSMVLLVVSFSRDIARRRYVATGANVVLTLALSVSVLRWFQIGQALETGLYFFTQEDVLIGCIGVAALLELTRRAFGLPLVIVCLLVLAYAFFGQSLPSIFRHGGYSLE